MSDMECTMIDKSLYCFDRRTQQFSSYDIVKKTTKGIPDEAVKILMNKVYGLLDPNQGGQDE